MLLSQPCFKVASQKKKNQERKGRSALPCTMAATSVVQVDFTDILAELEADKDLQETIREHQKELDRSSRSITTVLNKIHSTPSDQGKSKLQIIQWKM